jgi:coproporphyrinogen III oxidase-like Fe-S oxidoreductase
LKGIFEKDVISLKNVASGPKEAREKLKKKKEARLINSSATVRKVHILYRHHYLQFSNFSKYISKHFDNTLDEYIRSREEQIQEVSGN